MYKIGDEVFYYGMTCVIITTPDPSGFYDLIDNHMKFKYPAEEADLAFTNALSVMRTICTTQ